MKANEFLNYLSDALPYRRRRSADWMVPGSIGIGVGIAFGVGIGLLLAPRSGEQTRQKLRERASHVRERAMSATQHAKGELSEAASGAAGERSFAREPGETR